MRGFIIDIRKVKNEDLIVTVLSRESVKSYWRFFGTRHAILQIGNLIEFEAIENKRNFMPNMRSLSQLSFPWTLWEKHLFIWQNFIQLFEAHLKDSEEVNPFYFNLLMEIARKWDKQNPKRLAIEAYIKLLKKERRLHHNEFCYLCEERLQEKIGLMRAFIPAHPHCVEGYPFEREAMEKLFQTNSTIHLKDTVIENIYPILLKGL